MGMYIEDQMFEHKIEWITRVATNDYKPYALDWEKIRAKGEYPICVVDNGYYRAVAVCYSENEMNVFKPEDGRPKTWYGVPEDIVKKAAGKKQWSQFVGEKA